MRSGCPTGCRSLPKTVPRRGAWRSGSSSARGPATSRRTSDSTVRSATCPVAGAPSFVTGDDYVLFLWKGRSGINQVMGLSQGTYSVKQDGAGNQVLLRPATTETMVDKNGALVKDAPSTMKLSELRDRMQTTGAAR